MKKLVTVCAVAMMMLAISGTVHATIVPTPGTYQMVPGPGPGEYSAQLEMFLDENGNGTTVRDLFIYGFWDQEFGLGNTFYWNGAGGLLDENYAPLATVDTFDVTVEEFSSAIPYNMEWSAVITGTFLDYPSATYTIDIVYDGEAINVSGPDYVENGFMCLDGIAYAGTITIVPEPATICLLGLGGLLLRKRKA